MFVAASADLTGGLVISAPLDAAFELIDEKGTTEFTIQEVIDRLPIGGLEEPVSEEVFRRFVTAQAEGRVA